MLALLFYYIALPLLGAWGVILFIRKYGRNDLPEEIQAMYDKHPIEPKWFRVIRRDRRGIKLLGDFEHQVDAVDRAYKGKEEAAKAKDKAAFLVLNDAGETLEETDS